MKIIVVGVGCVAAKYLPGALRAAGHEPVFVADPAAYTGPSRRALETCVCLPADIADAEDVLRALTDQPGVLDGAEAITSPFDETFPVVRRVAGKLGLACPPPTFAALADKSRVAALVPEHSPWTAVFRPRELPPGLAERAPGPVLVKPSLCTGALGVRAAASTEEVAAAVAGSGVPGALDQPWLLQQIVEGDLISLEGFLRAGGLTVIGFSRRTRIGATEVSNLFPAAHTLEPAVREQCVRAVRELAERGGLRDGYVHAEFLAGAGRAHLIDANAGRLGGAAVVEQIALAHQVEPGAVAAHALLLSLGAADEAPPYRPAGETRETTSFWYGLRDGGVVRAVTAPPDALHTQFAVAGQRVPPVGESDYAWVGMLTGLTADAERAIEQVVVHTDEGDRPAFCRPC
ncbi:ATP-grasp domain-containing protein [Nonomuraea sp. NPDC049419]|uniref:ATP-grasp domain-containing protein n=1 Tax=Nonomuraea sp. NPDC049419 TaxID=3155772 RepID=UPI003429509E